MRLVNTQVYSVQFLNLDDLEPLKLNGTEKNIMMSRSGTARR